MTIIRAVDVSYFRSIYRARLPELRSVNVLSGRNDVGKSNILKALNLFFNGQTDWQTSPDFYRDFSYKRLEQVRRETVKGKQFISVTVDFNRPDGYKGSLPETFRVKRTWHRDGQLYTESNNLDALARAGRLPSTLATARRFLPILLNRIHFEYVPAVKDRSYFDHLLQRLQGTLLDIPTGADNTISRIAGHLAEHIQDKIVALQTDFERATGIRSSVIPPAELSGLFQAFLVSTEAGDQTIPLALRGDGIQARYVASVLRYIYESSNDYFVWGFEEPENSLEYSHVVELARDFRDVYSKGAQIFLTTHSPAFTTLRDDRCTCYRVYRENSASEVALVWPDKGSAQERAKLNLEMGMLRIQEALHEEYLEQNRQLQAMQSRLRQLLQEGRQAAKPLLLTEGRHDKQILEIAWMKCRPDEECPFLVRVADPAEGEDDGGSAGAGSLRKMIESLHPDDQRIAIALFDRDRQGLREFAALSRRFERWQGRDDVKRHTNRLAFAVLLPIPPGRTEYAALENLAIEHLFTDEVLSMRTQDGRGLEFGGVNVAVFANERRIPFDGAQLSIALEPARPITGGKRVFAEEIVPALQAQEFREFLPLFDTILSILRSGTRTGDRQPAQGE